VLLAAPYAASDVSVKLVGPVTSEPYLQMTLAMMEQWGYGKGAGGLELRNEAGSRMVVVRPVRGGKKYAAREYAIEPDASNASYFLAAAALVKGSSITIDGLGKRSLQGDVGFADVLHQMGAGLVFGGDFVTVMGTGVLKGIDIDLNAMPDMVQTLAVVALFAQGQTVIRNVGNLRVKETDRLAALEAELRKMGAKVETTDDSISIDPPAVVQGARIATYDDHRMAMAFAVAGLRVEGPSIEVENPECVGKTYPDYFRDLAAAVG
jgi:3-phosphoshikimate 1-carboxyvinyltransferase